MDILLNDSDWKLKGFWPYVPMLNKSKEIGNELMGITEWIDAVVPGGVHYDLLKAGLIEEPYFERNSLKCEWVENRWWLYKTQFKPGHDLLGKRFALAFKGIDYKAHFFLNGEKLGVHEGMYTPVVFDITGKLAFEAENTLEVLFESAPEEMGQIGHTSMTRTQKSRFNYKWDFGTRLVNIGIWDDVLIKATGDAILEDVFVSGDVTDICGEISINAGIALKSEKAFTVHASISFGSELIWECNEEIISVSDRYKYQRRVAVRDPKLWYPNGAGDQNLYEVKIDVFNQNGLSDSNVSHTGIRRLEYRRNTGSSSDSFPYTFVINGMPVYIKGVNMVPFDHLYGSVSRERYDRYMHLIKSANINMVRIWGGGIIEKEYFYDLCDRNGILVWQEFIQSSSGIDNMPSEDPHFLRLLKASAMQAVKTKRNHVCHIVWSGGNELTDENNIPVTFENPNINMLKDIVNKYDPGKLFLPTSASGPNEFLDIERPGTNHDVHGNWKYEGIENHYIKYGRSDSLFHSEVGVDGCSSIESMKRFLSSESLAVTNMKDNLVWRHHGEWWDTLERDKGIFGDFASLEQFAAASQFIQAEGLRYIVEANRRRKFSNSGTIIWQLNEPWPNVSCTSMVDYYGIPKMAYYWVKKAYSPIHVSLAYDRLFFRFPEEFEGDVFVHNSTCQQELTCVWEMLDVNGTVIERQSAKSLIFSNSVVKINSIKTVVPPLSSGIFFVRLSVYDSSDRECSNNLYVFSQLEKEIFSPLLQLEKAEIQVEEITAGYKVKNVGGTVCLFVHGVEKESRGDILLNENYVSIFPGEEHIFTVNPGSSGQHSDSRKLNINWGFLNNQSLYTCDSHVSHGNVFRGGDSNAVAL